jgi:hypothetical protein
MDLPSLASVHFRISANPPRAVTSGRLTGSILVRSSGEIAALLGGRYFFKNVTTSSADGRPFDEIELQRLMKAHRESSIPPPLGREGIRPRRTSLIMSPDSKSCQGRHPEKI